MTLPSAIIPTGLCQCGCGRTTGIARANNTKLGWIKGRHVRYVRGHSPQPRTGRTTDIGTFKIDGVYCRLIPLTKDMYCIVDASDFEQLTAFKWHASFHGGGKRSCYAMRNGKRPGGTRVNSINMANQILGLETTHGVVADHINGNSLDNRRANLRIATASLNTVNHGVRSDSKSGLKGVYHDARKRKPWRASVYVSKRKVYLGSFSSKESAYRAYCSAAVELHGEFARLA